MSSYARVKELYLEVFELPPPEREAYLMGVTNGNEQLVRNVLELFAYETDTRVWNDSTSRSIKTLLERSAAVDCTSLPDVIGGYRLIREIGQGAMGVVFEAEQPSPKRRVALKILRRRLADPVASRRFALEAEIQGRLDHPGIVRIIEARIDEGAPFPFLAMEFVAGQNLREYVRQHNQDRKAKLLLIQRLCQATHYAHARGVIHRDLKPSNILVNALGMPKILDFGIAAIRNPAEGEDALRTLDGEIIGTLSYMSPEQATGQSREVDLQSDVYALGVIAYELLSGHLPRDLDGKDLVNALAAIRSKPPLPLSRWISDIPKDVETIIQTALSTDREYRYPTAAAMATDIAHYLHHEPINARPSSSLHQLMLFAKRKRALVVGTSAVVVALLIGLIATLQFAFRANESAHKERRQKLRAERAVTKAIDAQEREQQASYEARITAASAAIAAGRPDEAKALLEDTTPELRGFEWRHLMSRMDNSAFVQGPSQDVVGDVCFGPEGTVVIGRRVGFIEFIDPKDQRVSRKLSVDPRLQQFDLSRSGQFLYTLHQDGSLFSYDLWAGDKLRFPNHNQAVRPQKIRAHPTLRKLLILEQNTRSIWIPLQATTISVRKQGRNSGGAWDPTGERLAVAPMTLVDGESGRNLGTVFKSTEVSSSIAWSPDCSELAVGTKHPGIHVINSKDERRRLYVRATGKEVSAIAYSPIDPWIVYGSDQGNVEILRTSDGEHVAHLLGHEEKVLRIAFSPDGSYVAAATQNWVRLWNSKPVLRNLEGRGHSSYVHHLAFSPNGQYLASFAWDSTVRLWCGESARALKVVAQSLRPPKGLAWTKDAQGIIADSFSLARIALTPGSEPTIEKVGRRKISPDISYPGRLRLEARALDGTIARVPPSDRKLLLIRRPSATSEISIDLPAATQTFALSPDGAWCAVACRGYPLRIIEIDSRRVIHEIESPDPNTYALAFSRDGQRLAVGGQRSTIRLFDTKNSNLVAILHGHRGDIRALCFSNDGSRLASGSSDQSIRIWSTRSTAEAHRRAIQTKAGIAFAQRNSTAAARRSFTKRPRSQFGAAIVTGDIDGDGHPELIVGSPGAAPLQTGSVHVMDPRTGNEVRVFQGPHPSAAFGESVALLRDLDGDGHRDLAVGAPGFDNTTGEDVGGIFLLSSKTGRVIRTIAGEAPFQRFGDDLSSIQVADDKDPQHLLAQTNPRKRAGEVRILSTKSGRTIHQWQSGKGPQRVTRIPETEGRQRPELAIAYADHIRIVSAKSGKEHARVALPRFRFRSRTLVPIEDVDSDGVAEFIIGHQSSQANPLERVYCLTSGGEESWSIELPRHFGSPRIHALPDLDGDGISDIAVAVGPHGNKAKVGFRSLQILSGLSGATLETVDYEGKLAAQSVHVSDIDSNGSPELILGIPSRATIEIIPLNLNR